MSISDPNKITVALLCDHIAPGGGPPGYTYNLLKGAADIESPVSYLTIASPSDERNRATTAPKRPGAVARALRWAAEKLNFLRPLRNRVGKSVREVIERADVVILQGYQPSERARYARKLGKTTLYMPHSPTIMADEKAMIASASSLPFGRRARRMYTNNERKCFIHASHIVFPSPNAASEYVSSFGHEMETTPVHYISSGVGPVHAGVPRRLVTKDEIAVLFVGRYIDHKGYDLFLNAASAITPVDAGARFFTLGDGPLRREEAAVTDLGWSSDPIPMIAGADIVVVPNRIAYYDLLPLEAAQLGKPMVMTRVGGNIDQLQDLPDTVAASLDDLSSSIRNALDSIRQNRTWGSNNSIVGRDNFSASAMALRWATLIVSLIDAEGETR